MLNSFQIIFFLVIVLVITTLIFIYKYMIIAKTNLKSILKASSIPIKLLFVVVFVFLCSLPVQLIYIVKSEPRVSNYSSNYKKIIKVNDGYIAIGFISNSRVGFNGTIDGANIVKYDFEGNIKWRDNYKYEDRHGSFDDIELTSEGNIMVTGTDGDYYDGRRHIAFIYSQEGDILSEYVSREGPFKELNNEERRVKQDYASLNALYNDKLLKLDYDGELNFNQEGENDEEEEIVLSIININGEEIRSYTYKYKPNLNLKRPMYWMRYGAELVGKTSDKLFIRIYIDNSNKREEFIVEEHLLILDYNLNLLQEYITEKTKSITKVKEHNGYYYMLLNNYLTRESFIHQYDTKMRLYNENQITANSRYTEIRDVVFNNNQIYIVGYEYQNQKKIGFSDNYSGFVMVYNEILLDEKYYFLSKGLGVNCSIIDDNQLISVGFLNSTAAFLTNNPYRKYPYKGFLAKTDLNKYKTKVVAYL